MRYGLENQPKIPQTLTLGFKGFSGHDVHIAKTMMRLRKFVIEGEKARMKMRGVK